MVGRVGLEPTLSLRTWFTVRGDTNYALPTHMVLRERFELSKPRSWDADVCLFHHRSIFWWHLRDSNSALPDWKSGVLTIRLRCRIGSSCENWTRVSGLRIRRRNHLTKEPYLLGNIDGGSDGTRTRNLLIDSQVLLSVELPSRIW